jgi:MFS family permease
MARIPGSADPAGARQAAGPPTELAPQGRPILTDTCAGIDRGGAAEAGSTGKPGAIAWPTEIVLLGSGLFGNLAMSVLSPALPLIEKSFAGEPHAAYLTKMLVSASGVGAIFVSLFAGTLINRFGRRRTLLAAYAIFIVSGVMGLWLPTLWAIIASRVVTSAAGALVVTGGITLISDMHQGRSRERRIGASHAIGALLLGLLVPFAGYLADFNWRWAFLTHLIALPMLACVFFSKELGRLDARIAERRTAQPARGFPPSIVALGLLTLAAGSIGYSVQIYVPFHLHGIHAYSGAVAGALFSITVLCSIATSFLYAELRRWVSSMGVFVLVFLGWSAGLLMMAFAEQVSGVSVGIAVFGLAGGLLGPNLFSLVAALTDETNRPRSIGLVKGIYYAGPFVGPVLLQSVYQRHGVDSAMLCLAGAAAFFFVLCLGLAVRGGRSGASSPS